MSPPYTYLPDTIPRGPPKHTRALVLGWPQPPSTWFHLLVSSGHPGSDELRQHYCQERNTTII